MKDSRKTIIQLMASVQDSDLDDLLWVVQQYAAKQMNGEEKKEVAA